MTRVLHTTTWDYFTSQLPDRFCRSPKLVKEVIMIDINDLVQELSRTSSDGDVGASFFAMRGLYDILHRCFDNLEVCFDIILIFATVTAVDLYLIKIYRCRRTWIPEAMQYILPCQSMRPTLLTIKSELSLRYCLMGIERCLISHFLNPKI